MNGRTTSAGSAQRRAWLASVWSALEQVFDPELDESVVEMGFIESVDLDAAARVAVCFRLPTFWCSPNFAYLMAEDIVAALRALPWARAVRVELLDHMDGERINRGANAGQCFDELFSAQCEGDLSALRQTFEDKALQRRQESLIRALRAEGLSDARLVALSLGELEHWPLVGNALASDRRRYLALRRGREPELATSAPAFTSLGGEPLAAAALTDHLSRLRQVRLNAEFNGSLCRLLAAARYKKRRAGVFVDERRVDAQPVHGARRPPGAISNPTR